MGPQESECWLEMVPQFTHAAAPTETLDVLPTRNPKINHLRKKVDAGHSRKLITTVRGVGYVLKE